MINAPNSIYDVVTTTPFNSIKELEHGDAVVVDIMRGMAYHWAIYDKEQDEFVELTRVDGRVKMVNAVPGTGWRRGRTKTHRRWSGTMNSWPRGVEQALLGPERKSEPVRITLCLPDSEMKVA